MNDLLVDDEFAAENGCPVVVKHTCRNWQGVINQHLFHDIVFMHNFHSVNHLLLIFSRYTHS